MKTSPSEVALELCFKGVGSQKAEKGEIVNQHSGQKQWHAQAIGQHKSTGCPETSNCVQLELKARDCERRERRLRDV